MALRVYRRRLPHWRLEGATYFVTWRLHRNQCPLGPNERETVFALLRRFDGSEFRLHALVVMDDHVHVVVTVAPGKALEGIVQAWKAFSALKLRRNGRPAPIWQREYYDRIVRGPRAFRAIIRYVADNPRRRWPGKPAYRWLWVAD
jgi:REP element-mobilizing transposase RayT